MSLERKNKEFLREVFSQADGSADPAQEILKRSGVLPEGIMYYEGRVRFGKKIFQELLRLCDAYDENKELVTIDITDDDELPDWAIDFSELRFTYKM
jgi:hypothetical protein